jgi:hypothetical protein
LQCTAALAATGTSSPGLHWGMGRVGLSRCKVLPCKHENEKKFSGGIFTPWPLS